MIVATRPMRAGRCASDAVSEVRNRDSLCVIVSLLLTKVQVSSIADNGTGILISGRDRIQQAVRCYLSNPVRFTKVDCPRTFQCDTAC